MKMVHSRSILFTGIALVVCAVFLPATGIFGEELSHPSLIDPAITKCAVCHPTDVSTHPEIAEAQRCLECHTLIEKSGRTFVVVDSNRQVQRVDQPSPATESVSGGIRQEGGHGGVPLNSTAGGDQPFPAVVAAAPTASLAEQTPPSKGSSSAGGGSARSGGSIESGMREFNRGDFDSAFRAWSLMLASYPDHFTLQVEVDTYLISAQSTIARYGDHSLYMLRKDDLYFVFSGLFGTITEAEEALKSLPEPLRRGGAFPIAVRQIVLHE